VLVEQREIRGTAADGFDEREAPLERRIRVRARRRQLDQARSEQIKTVAACIGQVGVAGAAPDRPQPRGQIGAGAETQCLQPLLGSSPGVEVALPQGRKGVPRRLLGRKYLLELLRYALAMRIERRGELVPGGEAHRTGNECAVRFIAGQCVRLGVVEILQAVLEPAQEDVGFGELRRGLLGKDPPFGKQGQDPQRWPRLQSRVASAADQLERLGDELDLADSARTQLDMVGEVAACHLGAYLGMQIAHCREGAKIEIFAVDERAHDGGQRVSRVPPRCALRVPSRVALRAPSAVALHAPSSIITFARQRPPLDPRVSLPFAPLGNEILLERVEARGKRSRIAPRPQAHVDAEHLAVRGRLAERADQSTAEAGEKLVIGQGSAATFLSAMFLTGATAVVTGAGAAGFPFLRIDEYEIDIRGHVQLAAAELAHPHHDEALAFALFV
jgi:hypothetical protein